MGVIDRQAKQQMSPTVSSGPEQIMNQGSYSFSWLASPWAPGSNKFEGLVVGGKGGILSVEAILPLPRLRKLKARKARG